MAPSYGDGEEGVWYGARSNLHESHGEGVTEATQPLQMKEGVQAWN